MSLVTHPATICLRSILRALGLTRFLSMLVRRHSYEEEVDKALLGAVRPGDTVWDIGANVGHYSAKLAEAVGPKGRIYAFEPSAVNRKQLSEVASSNGNIEIMPYGLSTISERVAFVQGDDDIGATSRVSRGGSVGSVEVELRRGDELVASAAAAQPNVIKVDVEGHEFEVLEGLGAVLSSPWMRAIVVEVHFGLLARDARAEIPGRIEKLLANQGFGLRWLNSSHLMGTR